MPRLYFRDPITLAMVPLSFGGAARSATTVAMNQARLRTSLQRKTPVDPNAVVTVGAVVDIVTALLANAGITVTPTEVINLMEDLDS